MDDTRLDSLLEHADWVRGLAESLLLDQVEVDDVVQQTWLAAIERAPRPVAAPRGWLASVVRNVALQMSRTERRRRRALPQVSLDHAGVEDRTAEHLDLHRRLVATVDALEDGDRTLIVMRYFEGRRPQDMARELDLPVTTVRNRLSRALERLRSRLDRESGGRRAWSLALIGFLTASMSGAAGAATPGTGAAGSGTGMRGVTRHLTAARLITATLIVGAFFTVQGLITANAPEEGAELAVAGPDPHDPSPARVSEVATPRPAPEAAVAVAGPESAQDAPRAAKPRLRGTVRDLLGAPIPGASVRVMDDAASAVAYDEISKFERRARGSEVSASAVTDDQGRFDVNVVRPGAYRVVVSARGYSLGVERVGALEPGCVAELAFSIGEVPRIVCVVLDERGEPLSGVAVTVHTPEGWVADHSLQLVERLETGEDGVFEFDLQQIQLTDVRDIVWDNLTAGRVSSRQAITLAKRGRVTRTVDRFGGLPVDDHGRLVLTMKPARDIAFTFVPPPGETITEPVEFLVKMFTSRIIRRGRSDASGHVVVKDLPETTIARFVVDSERWVVDYPEDQWIGTAPSQAGLPVRIPATGNGHAFVPLGRGAVLRGRAVDTSGRPVPAVELRVSPYGGNLGAPTHLRTAVTADDGSFVVEGVVPGRIGIFSASDDWAVALEEGGRTSVETGHRRGHGMEVKPGRTYDLVLEMVATATVRGRVRDEHGDPIAHARVGLAADARALAGWPPALHVLLAGATVRCDGEGRFEIGALVPGLDVELLVRDSRHRPTRCEPLSLDENEILEGVELVARSGAEVIVRVLDPDGAPIPDLDVLVSVGREYRFYPRRDDALGRTDADGRAVLRSLPRGPARVILGDVRRFGFLLPAEFESDLVVPASGEVRVDVVLVRPVPLRGRIVDRDGKPLAGVNVIAEPAAFDIHDVRRLHSIVAERMEFPPEGLRKGASLVASRRATTGTDGRFTILMDRVREYRLAVFESDGKETYLRPVEGDDVATSGGEPVNLVAGPRAAAQLIGGRSRRD